MKLKLGLDAINDVIILSSWYIVEPTIKLIAQ